MPVKRTASRNGRPPVRELREFQFIVRPVLLLIEDGKTPRPAEADTLVFTGLDELQAFVDQFPTNLSELNSNLNQPVSLD